MHYGFVMGIEGRITCENEVKCGKISEMGGGRLSVNRCGLELVLKALQQIPFNLSNLTSNKKNFPKNFVGKFFLLLGKAGQIKWKLL